MLPVTECGGVDDELEDNAVGDGGHAVLKGIILGQSAMFFLIVSESMYLLSISMLEEQHVAPGSIGLRILHAGMRLGTARSILERGIVEKGKHSLGQQFKMKLDVLPPNLVCTDEDEENLKQLLEAFGSLVSLEDIAKAYSGTGRNLFSTAEILCNKQGNTTGTSESQDNVENTTSASSGSPSNNFLENDHTAKLKPKRCPASLGIVSNVIGREYIAPRPQSNGSYEKYKPVKINSDDFPVSEIWDEKKEPASRSESMNSDIEEFLFKMLGNGFQLEMGVIHDVVGQCGYNMQVSIDKLLDLSAASLDKSDDVIGIAAGKTINSFDQDSTSSRAQSSRSNTDVSNGDDIKKKDIQREVLEALFSVPGRIEAKQEPALVRLCRPSLYGQVVTKPPEESMIEDFTFITRQPVNENNEANSYEELRTAVTEFWKMMKEYYKAAVDAFSEKDFGKAQKLMEAGNFYMKLAREADEKSAQKLIHDSEEEEECTLNMHYLEPKDALHHMRLHLTSLSGLPTIRFMKVVVGTGDGDKKDARRKRLITKLLEKEGIPWTEEGNGWTMSIQVDEIDPTKLSFANK
ncbi:hypothetical protein BUALT_Bualt03G0135300 [Buddleja alternifolia]|uniref:DUF1771 domain-containing protein n=1 Tax=Buddleja alternifolia TaxID=168488 RepID=A0AAV6XTH5_9LAMI|nr:hypothetical protein BUALT_Bualt03G0135300 [Buddleja alternifolia]